MSKLIPRSTIDAIRNAVDVALDIIGIECTLYIPTNASLNTAEKLDVWQEDSDYTFLSYSSMVYLFWNPSKAVLRKFGIFHEGALPIMGRFGNTATALEGSIIGSKVEVNIVNQSYFRIAPEFIPSDYSDVEEFEIVSPLADGMHDAVLTQMYHIAPRRIKQS